MKRKKMPVFWGGAFSMVFPLEKSDYGFRPSDRYSLSIMALSGPLKFVKAKAHSFRLTSIGLSLNIEHAMESEWNGVPTPNSKATAYIPGVSFLFASKAGTFGINV